MENQNQPVNELTLIKLSLSGDKTAYSVLIDNYKNSIFYLMFRMTGNYHDAEDLSQETFFRAYKHLVKFEINRNFRNWLYTIAVNLCKNKLKRDKIIEFVSLRKKAGINQEEVELQVTDYSNIPEELAIKAEEKNHLVNIVNSLPIKYKTVFSLRYVDDLSYKEISEITGLPLGTVEIYLFRAKKHILNNLSKDEILNRS